jgi:hypothetical protein
LVDDPDDRQNRTFRGYQLLLRHVLGFEAKLVETPVPELGVFFKDVSHLTGTRAVLIGLLAAKGCRRCPRRRCCQFETSGRQLGRVFV